MMPWLRKFNKLITKYNFISLDKKWLFGKVRINQIEKIQNNNKQMKEIFLFITLMFFEDQAQVFPIINVREWLKKEQTQSTEWFINVVLMKEKRKKI